MAKSRRGGRRGSSRTRRRSWTQRILRVVGLLSIVGVVLLAGYLIQLDHRIVSTFEGRRWSISARVYARPLELFAGERLSAEGLAVELDRLGYRQVDALTGPGSYTREPGRISTVLRPFVFPDGSRPALPLRVTFADGRIDGLRTADGEERAVVRLEPPLIGSIFPGHGEDRLIVPPGGTPALVTGALKAVEDRNFDRHPGFDLRAIARAFWVNLRAGSIEQGGSTLTQQLVKSYFLDNRRTYRRKFTELLMAIVLELRYEKAELLNAYINEVYIGQDGPRAIHGFGLGSQFYFGKPLAELDPAEAALLVAVIRGPSYYNPYRHPERALARRDRVLAAMHEFDVIDEAGYERAVAAPLGLTDPARVGGRYHPGFMDLVRARLEQDYDPAHLTSEGLRIFTTLEPRVQEQAERAVDAALDRIERARELPPDELQVAVVVTSTQTGEVHALIGGRKPGFRGFNHAVEGRRPIGSLIKPVVHLGALESERYHLASPVEDASVELVDEQGRQWRPENFDREVHGKVPLVRALADSLNLATVRLGLDVGVETVARRLGQLLDAPAPPPYPSLLLGAVELSPVDVSRLYGVFASGGFAAPPKVITAVEDAGGERVDRYPLSLRQVVAADHTAEVARALQVVVSHGTGRRSRHAGAGVAGKTGTSDELRDAWFAGFDGRRQVVVWVGYGDGRPSGLTGSSGALPVWDAVLEALGPEPLVVPPPRALDTVTVDYRTGLRVPPDCGEPVRLPLPPDDPPPLDPRCAGGAEMLTDRVRRWLQ